MLLQITLRGLLITAVVAATDTDQDAPTEYSITRTNKDKRYRPGELIFADEFDTLDCETWTHEITLGGNDRWEYQIYHNSRKTSYVKDGVLFIKPRPTHPEEYNIYEEEVSMNSGAPAEPCTNAAFYGCWRKGSYPDILNPILSAQLTTIRSFYFQYGRVEIRAKLPGGDWMWPAFRMWSKFNKYGPTLASGEFNIMESRGNQKLFDSDGSHAGSERVEAGVYFGSRTTTRNNHTATHTEPDEGFDKDFHIYGLEWTDEYILFSVDNITLNKIVPSEGGFWEMGRFPGTDENPWEDSDFKRMAPFDQKYFLVMNVAVGGVNAYFGDHLKNDKGKKPWRNSSPRAKLDFWEARDLWLPTWEGENGALQVDYVRVYAI